MGLISRIFGSEKALSATIKGVTNGLDALVYTDEERATDAKEERKQARQMIVGWMEKTQGQNLARRFIAMVVTLIWAVQYVLAMAMDAAAVWITDERLTQSADSIRAGGESVTGAMMLVLAFYFGAPYAGQIIGGAMDKFAGKK